MRRGSQIINVSSEAVETLHLPQMILYQCSKAGLERFTLGLHRELELYVQAGFTPMEAIQAATTVPARVMGLDKESGTIETGKRADLILIGEDPLQDIHNTRKVVYVITNGTLYHTAELWQSAGFKP